MPNQTAPEPQTSRLIPIFALVSIIFVTIGIITVFGLVMGSRFLSATPAANGQYNVAARRVPQTSNLGAVLPAKVSTFNRATNTVSGPSFSGTYTGPSGTITVQGLTAVSISAAEQRVANLYGATPPRFTDPMIFQSTPPDKPRFVWSHDRWYFDVTASSPAALNEFMTNFPY
ncbi:MAG TPA: hypothetical protein VMT34_15235 [Aggregatilineales bacterium]|nr:hypothetical protein [Aggregatilineales bacterium]